MKLFCQQFTLFKVTFKAFFGLNTTKLGVPRFFGLKVKKLFMLRFDKDYMF